MNDRIDPIDAVKAVLGFPGYETAQEMTPELRIGEAIRVLAGVRAELREREHNHDYRADPYERFLNLADQITGAAS